MRLHFSGNAAAAATYLLNETGLVDHPFFRGHIYRGDEDQVVAVDIPWAHPWASGELATLRVLRSFASDGGGLLSVQMLKNADDQHRMAIVLALAIYAGVVVRPATAVGSR